MLLLPHWPPTDAGRLLLLLLLPVELPLLSASLNGRPNFNLLRKEEKNNN